MIRAKLINLFWRINNIIYNGIFILNNYIYRFIVNLKSLIGKLLLKLIKNISYVINSRVLSISKGHFMWWRCRENSVIIGARREIEALRASCSHRSNNRKVRHICPLPSLSFSYLSFLIVRPYFRKIIPHWIVWVPLSPLEITLVFLR